MAVDLLSLENGLRTITSSTSWDDFLRILLESLGYPAASYERARCGSPEEGIDVHGKLLLLCCDHFRWEDVGERVRGRRFSRNRFLIVLAETKIFVEDRKLGARIVCEKSCAYKCADILRPLLGLVRMAPVSQQDVTLAIGAAFAELYHDLLEDNDGLNRELVDEHLLRLLRLCFLDGESLLGKVKVSDVFRRYAPTNRNAGEILDQIYQVVARGYTTGFAAALEGMRSPHDLEFAEVLPHLKFSKASYECFLDILDRGWANVDIAVLGGIVQSVVEPRSGGYRQVLPASEYIYKLIGPLFLDSLYDELSDGVKDRALLTKLACRIREIKVFDPSCSFGAILISSYEKLTEIASKVNDLLGVSNEGLVVPPANIYGIEESAFSLAVAKLSFLWLFFRHSKGTPVHRLEVAMRGVGALHLVHGRAPRMTWSKICIPGKNVYLVSNPPYVGARKQSTEDKMDMVAALGDHFNKIGDLDLATCWLFLGGRYVVAGAAGCAFMTTNSLVQGVHAGAFWPQLLSLGCKISFAHSAFKLRPVISRNAPAVTVVVVGLAEKSSTNCCSLIAGGVVTHPQEISPYLLPGHTIVYKSREVKSAYLPKMNKGNMPYDGGHLMIDDEDTRRSIIGEDQQASRFIKRVVGSEEFINEIPRWCIWVRDADVDEAMRIAPIERRIEKCRQDRAAKKDQGALRLAMTPWRFREQRETTTSSIVVPSVSSENREYIPIGFISSDTIVTNLSFVIYDCEPWVFGILASKLHNLWIRTVCGGLETRLRYSSELGYNTFPVPEVTAEIKARLTELVRGILIARGQTPGVTLGTLYDDMPGSLRSAHRQLDVFVENWYKPGGFASDAERITYLMKMYEGGSVCKVS